MIFKQPLLRGFFTTSQNARQWWSSISSHKNHHSTNVEMYERMYVQRSQNTYYPWHWVFCARCTIHLSHNLLTLSLFSIQNFQWWCITIMTWGTFSEIEWNSLRLAWELSWNSAPATNDSILESAGPTLSQKNSSTFYSQYITSLVKPPVELQWGLVLIKPSLFKKRTVFEHF